MKFNPPPLEIALLTVIGLAFHLWARYGKRIRRWLKEWRKRRRGPRQLKPREPGDCPLCRAHICWLHPRSDRHVVPWSEVKNQAGRPKTIDTTGYACFDPDCKYFLITDPMIHALVSDGWAAKRETSCTCAARRAAGARPAACIRRCTISRLRWRGSRWS